jgi:hypothetical protein
MILVFFFVQSKSPERGFCDFRRGWYNQQARGLDIVAIRRIRERLINALPLAGVDYMQASPPAFSNYPKTRPEALL